jgi:hypothetical protein
MRRTLVLTLLTLATAVAANITKTVQTELKAITNVAAAAQSISSVFSSTTHLQGTVFIDIAPEATNTPGTELRVEISQKDSGNDTWIPFATFISTTLTSNTNAVDGTEAAASTVIEEATTTGIALNQYMFFKNGTIGNSEWSRVVAFTGSTSFTVLDGITNAQTSSTWYNRGERFVVTMDLTSIKRLRVVCNNAYAASSVAVNWRAALVTGDSIQ